MSGVLRSLHSGSDKFSVYPLMQEVTGGQVHLKTAGTSFLEALRVIAQVAPALFCEVAEFARGRYGEDRASYHVSAHVERIPALKDVFDSASGQEMPRRFEELAGRLDDFDVRQVLHVTFGSVLDRFGAEIRRELIVHEEEYNAQLERHFYRHLKPFTVL